MALVVNGNRLVTRCAPFLLFRCGSVCAALPLCDVRETFRPLPVVAIDAAPAFVLGMSVIRGQVTPVIDGSLLLDRRGGALLPAADGCRFIALRAAERPVALAVDAVLGIRDIPAAALADLPPLLGDRDHGPVEQLAQVDGNLWMLLRAGRLVPDMTALESGLTAALA